MLILIIGIFLVGRQFIPEKNTIQLITSPPVFNPTTIPTSTIRAISPTTSSIINCNAGNIRNENCPPGCVYYGMPLGCVTKEYYDNCKKTHNCPL